MLKMSILRQGKSASFFTPLFNSKMLKNLAAFDFDHTIVDANSDTAIVSLIDGDIPPEVKELNRKDGWTAYMQGIFDIFYKKKIEPEAAVDIVKNLKPVEGMTTLLTELKQKLNYDIIVISDSNSCFINAWLNNNNLQSDILKVFTNPAQIDNGLLSIKMYHLQDFCDLSTKNLCKGHILEDFIENQRIKNVNYNKIVYVGDGANDFCPILRLGNKDLAFVRENYKCSDLVKKSKEGKILDKKGVPRKIKAETYTFQSGIDILNKIREVS